MAHAGRRRAKWSATTKPAGHAAPVKAVSELDEHRVRLERQAQDAAYPQQRVGARIRWAAVVLGALVVVSSGVLVATVSRTSGLPPAALSSVPRLPAIAPQPTSSASRPPAPAVAPPTALTMSVTATQSSAAQPPAPVARSCSTADTSSLNDNAADITYSGSWRASRDRGFGDFDDDVHFTKSDGSSVSYSFTGTGISLIGETNDDQGQLDVYLDGTLQRTVDTTSETRSAQQVVFTTCGLQPGYHNIRAVKRSGEFMVVDRFDVMA